MYSVGICGEAVTQLATDTVTKSHLVAGNTKQIKTSTFWSVWSLCGAADVVRQWGARGRLPCFTSSKIRQKVIDFPMTYPTPPKHTLQSQTAGVVNMHTISHEKKKPCSLNPEPYPPPWPSDHPLFSYLSLAVSLSLPLSHLCLCRAAAAQRTEGAAFTSEHISHQMSPFAASPSNIQADNAPCILNIWLTMSPTKGAGWCSGLPTAMAGKAQSHVDSDTYSLSTHT